MKNANKEQQFTYDVMGNRLMKINKVNGNRTDTTFYLRDAEGELISVYEKNDVWVDEIDNSEGQPITIKVKSLTQTEYHLYGSSRLGMDKTNRPTWKVRKNGNNQLDILLAVDANFKYKPLGEKRYELSNHLGNVSVVFTDRKLVAGWRSTYPYITSYKLDVRHSVDYYAFGLEMEATELQTTVEDYRFGFNGKENDPEMEGRQDYGARIYNRAIGRWFATDPDALKYPRNSPYVAFNNNPLYFVDPTGRGLDDFHIYQDGTVYKILNGSKTHTYTYHHYDYGKSGSTTDLGTITENKYGMVQLPNEGLGYFTTNYARNSLKKPVEGRTNHLDPNAAAAFLGAAYTYNIETGYTAQVNQMSSENTGWHSEKIYPGGVYLDIRYANNKEYISERDGSALPDESVIVGGTNYDLSGSTLQVEIFKRFGFQNVYTYNPNTGKEAIPGTSADANHSDHIHYDLALLEGGKLINGFIKLFKTTDCRPTPPIPTTPTVSPSNDGCNN